ncbi:MAG: hypothetical protein U9O20_00505 [Patescibacteria group bacterium]|nr:hypothetical protein [Patescibacteria group bacterium]
MKKTIWVFLDTFMLLCIAFLIAAQVETKESNASDRPVPKIHIFIEKTEGDYGTKCNGRYVETRELSNIIQSSFNEGVQQVQVIAMIEEDIPYGYVDRIKNTALSAKIEKHSDGKKLRVAWDSTVLTSFTKK